MNKLNIKNFSLSKYRVVILAMIIVVLSLIIQVRNSSWLTLGNVIDVLVDTSILGMLALGMMIVILTGGIDLSAAAILSFTCMLAPALMIEFPNLAPFWSFVAAIVCGGLMGLINGFLVAKGNLIPIIATLGTMNIYRGLNLIIIDNYGGWITSSEMHQSFMDLSANVKPLGLHIYVWFMIILYAIFAVVLNYTRYGRRVYAVGSNPEAVIISGVNRSFIIITAYTIMGLIAGFCGPLWAGRYSFAQGDSALGFEMFVIAACVIGGVSVNGGIGKVSCVFFGAMLIGVIKNALPMLMISTFWQNALQGAIILASVVINVLLIRRSQAKALIQRSLLYSSKKNVTV